MTESVPLWAFSAGYEIHQICTGQVFQEQADEYFLHSSPKCKLTSRFIRPLVGLNANFFKGLIHTFFGFHKCFWFSVKLKTNNCIVFTDFQHTKLSPFQNLSLGFILKIFLKFRKFQPRYSYKLYSYKKWSVQL